MGSSYFRTLINDPINHKEIKMSTVNADDLKLIIQFIYCGTIIIEDDQKILFRLMEAANLMCITEIVDYCLQMLEKTIHVDNCISRWLMTRKLGAFEKIQIMSFLEKNYETIRHTEELMQLNQEAIIDLLSRFFRMGRREELENTLFQWIKYDPEIRSFEFSTLSESIFKYDKIPVC